MRSLRLMGSDVIPAVREIADELELKSPFEVDPKNNQPIVDSNTSDSTDNSSESESA